MSNVTSRSTLSSKTSSTTANDRTRYPYPSDSNHLQKSMKTSLIKSSPTNFSKQIYTFSNPPRELQRQSIQTLKCLRHNRLRQRVSSAPDENSFQNSPRSIFNQQKPSSANESSTPRSHEEEYFLPLSSIHSRTAKLNEQERNSFNALMKEQERSKVPKAVQKRRIILLFRRLPPSTTPSPSPRQYHNASPTIKFDPPRNETNLIQKPSDPSLTDETESKENPFHFIEHAEIADSKQIAAILANIQSFDDLMPSSADECPSPRVERKIFDPKKYEYVATNSLDITTFKLSPRTLKPDEELAARSRFTQNYRTEMLSSANAQMPPLMASIVAENNNNMTLNTATEKTFTFRFNSTTMKLPNPAEEIEVDPKTIDGEEIQLCFDEILKCFYDPTTGTYYELTSS